MTEDIHGDSEDILDDIKIYHDNTIVSGDLSDPEFIEEMVIFLNSTSVSGFDIFLLYRNKKRGRDRRIQSWLLRKLNILTPPL